MSKVTCDKQECPCGWLSTRFLGTRLCVWVVFFAVLPFTARGVAWTARSVAGLWDSGARVVGVSNHDKVQDEFRVRGERLKNSRQD